MAFLLAAQASVPGSPWNDLWRLFCSLVQTARSVALQLLITHLARRICCTSRKMSKHFVIDARASSQRKFAAVRDHAGDGSIQQRGGDGPRDGGMRRVRRVSS